MNKLLASILFCMCFFVCSVLYGQNFNVQINMGGEFNGRGTVVHKFEGTPYGYILTANHVIDGPLPISVVFENGKVSNNCRVILYSSDVDIAIILACVPEDVVPAKIADTSPCPGDIVQYPNRTEGGITTIASPSTDCYIISSPITVVKGDSGSVILNENNEVCGIVCEGLEVNPFKMSKASDVLWPIRGRGLFFVKNILLESIEKGYLPTFDE